MVNRPWYFGSDVGVCVDLYFLRAYSSDGEWLYDICLFAKAYSKGSAKALNPLGTGSPPVAHQAAQEAAENGLLFSL